MSQHSLLATASSLMKASGVVRESLNLHHVSTIDLEHVVVANSNNGRVFDAIRIQGVLSYSLAQDLPTWQTVGLVVVGGFFGAFIVELLARSTECAQCEEASKSKNSSEKVEQKAESSSLPDQSTVASQSSRGTFGLLWTALAVFMMSIPALLGSCCWPLLAAGILGMARLSTPGSRAFAHALMFGLHFGMFAALLPKLVARSSTERTHIATPMRWAPVCLCCLGAVLVMVDLTRHVLLDLGVGVSYLPMYGDGGLTTVGKAGVVCTWVGMFALFAGTVWLIDLPSKLRRRWTAASGEQ